MENLFKDKVNVCLRDYSSYNLFKHLDNVQYAPDTIFLYNPIDEKKHLGKRAVISMIDPLTKVKSEKIEKSYYSLIKETIVVLKERGFKIDLVSFCNNEGDGNAIEKVYHLLESKKDVSLHYYNGNCEEILNLFNQSDFVIGSRFHSIILGFIFEKPTFPISYNCKTVNYLADLNFKGKFVLLDKVDVFTVNDVLYNYDNHIICKCDCHKKYAENQFYALKRFLNNDFDF